MRKPHKHRPHHYHKPPLVFLSEVPDAVPRQRAARQRRRQLRIAAVICVLAILVVIVLLRSHR